MSKATYLLRSIRKVLDPARYKCTNCGSGGVPVQRKYVIFTLRRCCSCSLLFRAPTDSPEEARSFYQKEYAQGFTTGMPSDEVLDRLKATNFSGQDNDYRYYVSVLKSLRAGPKLFEFGCSWGYGSYQLGQAGFDVTAYELSIPRRRYAQSKMSVTMIDNFEKFVAENEGTFDVFFSSHVLEHVPTPSKSIRLGLSLLKPGGLLVAFFPNGSQRFRSKNPEVWKRLWGQVHPNFIDDAFLDRELDGRGRLFASSPAEIPEDALSQLDGNARVDLDHLDRYEMMVAVRSDN